MQIEVANLRNLRGGSDKLGWTDRTISSVSSSDSGASEAAADDFGSGMDACLEALERSALFSGGMLKSGGSVIELGVQGWC